MTLTQILQKIKSAFYTKKEIDSMGDGSSLDTTIKSKANDSNVVHKSGDETINGVKSFNNDIVLNGNFNLRNNIDNGFIRVQGSSGEYKGSRLILSGKDRGNYEGTFELMATDGNVHSLLKGTKNGSLTWCSNNVDCIDSQGDDYIRYANGLQICWGTVNLNNVNSTEVFKDTFFAFPKSFISDPVVGTALNTDGSGWADFTLAVQISTTQMKFVQYTNRGISTTTSLNNKVTYTAIGKWK